MPDQIPSKPQKNILNLNLHSQHVISCCPLLWQLLWMRVPEWRKQGEPPSGHVIYSRLCRGKKMVFTSSGLVTHIPCFNHSTTHFHTWMLTRLERGSRIKNQQWLVCKRFSSFLSCFQGRGHCICPSPRMGRALEHSNKSNKHLLGTTASALRYWWLAGSSKLCHKGP